MDDLSNYFLLGRVLKTHGIRGELTVYLDTNHPERYTKMKSLFLETEGQLKQFKVISCKLSSHPQQAIVRLEGLTKIEEAEAYLKCSIYQPLSMLPKPAKNDFYFHEIIGFEVIDLKEGSLGPLSNIYDLPKHAVGEADWQGRKLLFPLREPIITEIDRTNKILKVDLPEGLADIYR